MDFTVFYLSAGFVILGIAFLLTKLFITYKQKEIYKEDPLNDSDIVASGKRIHFLKLEIKVLHFDTLGTISYCVGIIIGYIGIVSFSIRLH